VAREVPTAVDSKVAARAGQPETHGSKVVVQGRQWVRGLKVAVATVVSLVTPKVVALSAAVSMAHHRGADLIASA
jgi:hypothetical protein